jgi:hypothetical protein
MAYTTIDDPSAYFQTALWTGTGSVGNAVTFDGNSDMQPDFVWSKRRDLGGRNHVLKDTSRGGTSNNDLLLSSSLTDAESTYDRYRMDFNSDGFTLDGDGDTGFQGSGTSMVSWAWKANGGTTTAFSESGNNPGGTYQANTTAGFSIVTYTGTGAAGTVTHGLGVAPKFIIIKNRDVTDPWAVYYGDATDYLVLNTTAATVDNAAWWNDTAPSSTVFTVNTDHSVNADAEAYVAYAFAEKQGYSKFGSYVGNGSADGPFVYTGFKPAFLIMKRTDSTGNWVMFDTKRDLSNVTKTRLFPNLGNADNTTRDYIDLLSNGFKMRDTDVDHNASAATIIYMAFAENPFVTSTGIPATAR